MTWPINEDHPGLATQRRFKWHPLIVEIAAGAVDEEDSGALLAGFQLKIDEMGALAFGTDKRPGRRKIVFNRDDLRVGPGECDRQQRQKCNQDKQVNFHNAPINKRTSCRPPTLRLNGFASFGPSCAAAQIPLPARSSSRRTTESCALFMAG